MTSASLTPSTEFTIGRRSLYILPTRIGWYFSLILLALFAIAVKYNNQAAFMMLFVLVSLGLIAMIQTHNNVINLALLSHSAKAVFSGDTVQFPVTVSNASQASRQAIWLACDGFTQLLDIKPENSREVLISQPSVQRGYLNCPPIILSSHFPLGLFFCWSKRFESGQRCVVYPRPLDLIPASGLASEPKEQQNNIANLAQGDDYNGMKPYQEGDRPRDIHWPSLAKTHKLVTIQHQQHSAGTTNISWFDIPQSMNVEDKLSQLCHWVIEAENQQQRYQLEMPNHTISYDQGKTHLHKCLMALALWNA